MCLIGQEKTEEEKFHAKMDNMLRRMCTPKAKSGKIEVSLEVRNQWLKGGSSRKHLISILVSMQGNKDVRYQEVYSWGCHLG